MIYGQMNPEVAAALRGRLGIGMGVKNAAPASYQAPQFPGGMSQYTPQPQLPGQWGQIPQNTGIVPPRAPEQMGQVPGNTGIVPPRAPEQMGQMPGNTGIVPPHLQNLWGGYGGGVFPPFNPAPGAIGGTKGGTPQIPGATLPHENPIQAPYPGTKRGPISRDFMIPSWY